MKMESYTEMQKAYLKRMEDEEIEELAKNSTLIESFKNLCKDKGIYLSESNFKFIQAIGIVATSPNLLISLNDKIEKDKEDLVSCKSLFENFRKEKFITGFLFNKDYMAMVHPFFRRGMSEYANYAPRFIDLFWHFENSKVDSYISLDYDRVRINIDSSMYMELDTWYGASFEEDINSIKDGIVKIKPPLDLEDFDISFFFGNAYALDIKWDSKEGIKTFQAEEFKTDDVKVTYLGEQYFPVRYIHAEFDCEKNNFRHFDGAIHLYTHEEYFRRRDSDFNYNEKNNSHIKTKSLKLFKLNGIIDTKTWIEFSSHFFTGNPLIFEYFEGKYPDRINEIIEIRRRTNHLKA